MVHGVGGHGDDRQLGVVGVAPNTARRLQAVHHRHAQIHQDRIERFTQHGGDCFLAVLGVAHPHAGFFQDFAGQSPVQGVVFDQQHTQTLQPLRRLGGGNLRPDRF